jgi:hypothetical protein
MNHAEFLEKQWATYKQACKVNNIDPGEKEAFIARNMPKDYKPDYLLDKTPKPKSLMPKEPLFKAEENITISRRTLKEMLEDAAQKGYELAIKERSTNEPLQANTKDV